VLLAFEKAEALRNLRQLRPGGLVVINMEANKPLTVTSGGSHIPKMNICASHSNKLLRIPL
jgi:Pyruvate/2-oxoacid:ferredoxin oxidoreductase gamma subunit